MSKNNVINLDGLNGLIINELLLKNLQLIAQKKQHCRDAYMLGKKSLKRVIVVSKRSTKSRRKSLKKTQC
jgi:hypothetical protein